MHSTTLQYTSEDTEYSHYPVAPKEITFHYNSDFSGEVIISNGFNEQHVPGWMLKEIVGQIVASDLISDIEGMSGREILTLTQRMFA